MSDILVISDTQIKPNTDLSFCSWMGQYIAKKKPENIVVMGDWWDMKSLSVYDKGLKAAGKNYQADIDAGIKGMKEMLDPIKIINFIRRSHKKKQYKPNLFFLLGNHEERIERYVNDNPLLKGKVSYDDLHLNQFGFDVYPFLSPLKLHGWLFSHYIKNKNSSYPKASAKATIEQTMMSTFQGHKPGLDVHVCWNDRTGRNAWSIINGASYTEDEDFRHGSGNDHWRGIVHLRNVVDGDADPEFISMDYLKDMYDES